jgi:energy-coupling factor transporter ATP-binding protein EcfA2
MPLHFTTTREAARLHGVKICVHGRGGSGKTTLVKTLPKPILISAESGVLSLADVDIPTITISSFEDMEEAYRFIGWSEHARQFQSVALDSISEIAEQCLSYQKTVKKDGRAAYGEMNDQMASMIRKWRDLPGRHVYFSAKQSTFTDDISHVTRYGPSMPGQRLTNELPYFFDEVFSLEVGTNQETKENFRYLRTQTSLQYEAKDRSGALDEFEPPDLNHIIDKILAKAA